MIIQPPLETKLLFIDQPADRSCITELLQEQRKDSDATIVIVKENGHFIGSFSASDICSKNTSSATWASLEPKPFKVISLEELQNLKFDPNSDLLVLSNKGDVIGFITQQSIAQFLMEHCKAAQAFLDTLLDSVNDAVTCVDHEGTVLYWNRVAEEYYDVPRSEIVGKRIGEFFAQGSIMLFKILDEGRPIHHVYHHPRPDKHVLINASPIYQEQHGLIGAIATEQDISKIVKVNEELMNRNLQESTFISESEDPFHKMKGYSTVLHQAIATAKMVADLPIPVLITGEKGVGKRLLAQAIHEQRAKSTVDAPFLTIHVGTLPPSILESELFGYQANVFGGDTQAKPGKIELAANGTLLLDEAEHLPHDLQLKIAAMLEHGVYNQVGSQTTFPLQTRLLFTTLQPSDKLAAAEIFREELYYQLERATIHLPPLRERTEDILELSQTFLQMFAAQYHKQVPTLTPEVIAALTTYDWPGNIRQLRNTIERLVIFVTNEQITLDQLPSSIQFVTLDQLEQEMMEDHQKQPTVASVDATVDLQEMERIAILQALQKTAGNKAAAAKELGISRGTLYAKLRQLDIQMD